MEDDPEFDEVTLTKLTEVMELTGHAEALGHVSLAWTRLHEIMATLFGLLLRPVPEERAYAIWHSIRNDRSQRDMLSALAHAALPADSEARKAIKWAKDNLLSLENSRNDALHSPYVLVHDEERGPTMVANELTGNQRAANLSGRDLGVELESYKKNVTAVADYLWEVVRRLSASDNALALGRFGTMPPPPSLPKPAQPMTRSRRNKK
jgi:hypothetical protein